MICYLFITIDWNINEMERREMAAFSENLQFYRKKADMTQEELAERMEVSRQTISKWESGVSQTKGY